jgi:hypothetical protein
MQVQSAAVLGRLPSVCSLLVSTTQSEMDRFKTAHNGTAIDEDTPCVSVAQLWSGVQLSAANAPPAVVQFVRAAAENGDPLLPYYGLYRLARCLFNPNEEIAAATMNGVTSRFRTLLNGFRVQHLPATEPLKPTQLLLFARSSQSRLKSGISRHKTPVSALLELVEPLKVDCLQWKMGPTLCKSGKQQQAT